MSGYVDDLSEEQEEKLRELWGFLLSPTLTFLSSIYGVDLPPEKTSPAAVFKILHEIRDPTPTAVIAAFQSATNKNGSTMQDGDGKTTRPSEAEGNPNGALESGSGINGQKANGQKVQTISNQKVSKENISSLISRLRQTDLNELQVKSMERILSSMTPREMAWSLLNMVKQDSPDAVLLRFLRARKWDVHKAFSMMLSNYIWRVESNVDEDIMPNGELHALKESQNEKDKAEEKKGKDFLSQLRMGKSYLHGADRDGRPIIVVTVRIHKPGAQSEEALERYILHIIEMTRLLLEPPVETGTILFDMTGFTLSNMEFPPVKFIIQCFESNYPECLGRLLIHNAPWIFSGVWKLIRPLMDPVVASKVHFTKNLDELSKFIAPENICKELGGTDEWTYRYIEPAPSENNLMNDTSTRDELMSERMTIALDFILKTVEWIRLTSVAYGEVDDTKAPEVVERRQDLIRQFRQSHWKLDPYIRARNQMDRERAISLDGAD
ncbi:CRAL-TRIO domain-containing protein [Talaromyces proteolyticus]|uniref:CRAL-TRIO domain-containing protein n=1 Tax=Talaromyces proteolyticus TaxID=1131652 RepID=A0AAD4KVD3_9EURO|nr:CRAL-TRIO domain-containing protein [Talaromyces proteolyticus]KAH8696749.1 CRAL-TRIO domain-containing protein [Talaromyces proteolyticus]